ncbi:hypothetical protein ACHWQZ_G006455 [Mnemiopsis leidyi]
MTDLHDEYDDDFYEDDFTDDEDGRGSSKLLETSKSIVVPKPPPKRNKAFTSQTSLSKPDKRMTRRGEGRVQSSKRRQQMSLRNQYAELTVNYDDLLKENKLLKQIQKRQERELDRFTNADEDLPRLLDANNYEIAGLKAKNKQLLFEKREQDDKLRRQHQEIMTLKEENKKMTTLANNRKLGEREKLELELTTARVTIAHQENKIQDLTKAVEIYKKAADREVRGGQLQLRKAQNSLRDLQDAYNELFIKYKAKEKELGNQNIYAQRGRISSKRSHFRAGPSTQSNPNLSVQSFVSTTTPAAVEKREDKILKSQTSNLSSIERLESELELLNKQSDSLADLEKVLEEDKSPEPPTKSPPPKSPPRSPSTLASDSEDDLDEEEVKPTAPVKEPTPKPTKVATPTPATPAKTEISPPEPVSELQQRIQEEARLAQEFEKKKQEEAAKLAEEEKRKAKAAEEKARQAEEAAEAEAKRKAEEAKARKAEEERLLLERKKKDDALKEKLAAVRRNAGADDFMSQLKAKKNTPSVSPSESLKSDVRSPPAPAPTERVPRKSGSGDELRRVAALNNVNGRRKKSSEEDFTSGYQPSFATSRPVAGKIDPFGIEVNTVSEYTPSFSNNQRISRESANNSKVWTPTGRASTSERNGLFETSLDHKPLLKRRASKSKNMIPVKTYDQDDDLEELLL